MARSPVTPAMQSGFLRWLQQLLANLPRQQADPSGMVRPAQWMPNQMRTPPAPAPASTPWQGPPGVSGVEGTVPRIGGGSFGLASHTPSPLPATQTSLSQYPSSLIDRILQELGPREFQGAGVPVKPEEGPGVR